MGAGVNGGISERKDKLKIITRSGKSVRGEFKSERIEGALIKRYGISSREDGCPAGCVAAGLQGRRSPEGGAYII